MTSRRSRLPKSPPDVAPRTPSRTPGRRLAAFGLGLFLVNGPLAAQSPADSAPIDFAREVLPVLSNKCFACHGPDTKKESDLRLDSFEAATADRGGYRAIDPAAPEKSEILARIHDAEDPMPPADAEKQLSANERDVIDRWVRQGGEYAMHWAYVPPRKPSLPAVAASAPGSEIIDVLVREKLHEKGIEPAPEANKPTLARRAALVLTGLPPEPEQLSDFLNDSDAGAYDRLINSLLDSPRYGEHQARYWLDAVRYGDTHGLHLDNRRGIYPYRDWVVKAFNDNLSIDKFITWQLAGDLLPDPTLEQRVATGYVRMNPTTSEGGVLPEEFQAKNNFDRTETFGTVFLGASMNCARCHTHKYDPIPQTEYYRLMAFFNSTSENPLDGNAYEYGPVVKAPSNQAEWKSWSLLESEREKLLARAVSNAPSEQGARWASLARPERWGLLTNPQGPFAGSAIQKEAEKTAQKMAELEEGFTTTLVAKDLEKPRATQVLQRGEYHLPDGDPLQPGIVEVMGAYPEDAARNRLGLARWLTSGRHPLVARVFANRAWQQVFGQGLVRTPEDFGLQGEQPTHPKLLDWLAVSFQESGWDWKQLQRLMVTSQTFRQSSAWRHEVDDPENRLWARGPSYRLDAEVLRDIGLWAGELLDPHMGGEGVKPYQPSGIWLAMAHPASNTKQYVQDQGARLYRRSLYVYWKRTSPHPMMTLFDAPSREASCVRRSRSNTSAQSLGLLNETQRLEMARMLAERLLREGKDDTARLNHLFSLLACREPNQPERFACTGLLHAMRERYAGDEEAALGLLAAGEAPRDASLDPSEHAAWTQLAVTVLAGDIALMLY